MLGSHTRASDRVLPGFYCSPNRPWRARRQTKRYRRSDRSRGTARYIDLSSCPKTNRFSRPGRRDDRHDSGGQTHNVIPDSVTLKGTIRALKETVSEQARLTLEKLCRATEQAFGASISLELSALLRE